MISEREFSNHYGSFWRAALPNFESVTRALNLDSSTTWDQIKSINDPKRRDVIAETAFILASLKFTSPERVADLLPLAEQMAIASLRFLTRHTDDQPLPALNEDEIGEVLSAADRILQWSQHLQTKADSVRFKPKYFGHGFIHECEGDIDTNTDIFEFKYVGRNFRSADFKQALIYATLHWFKTEKAYRNLWLINCFRGVTVSVPISELVAASGGGSFQDFSRNFSQFVASGDISR